MKYSIHFYQTIRILIFSCCNLIFLFSIKLALNHLDIGIISYVAVVGFILIIIMTDYAITFFLIYRSATFIPRIKLTYKLADKNLEKYIGKVIIYLFVLSLAITFLRLQRNYISELNGMVVSVVIIVILSFFVKITWQYYMYGEKYTYSIFIDQLITKKIWKIFLYHLPYCIVILSGYILVTMQLTIAYFMANSILIFLLYPFAQNLANLAYRIK